jgi:hypothetical protein
MPTTYQDIEKRVIEACQYLETQEEPNIAKTARVFEVLWVACGVDSKANQAVYSNTKGITRYYIIL